MTIVEFLLARIGEDESIATAALVDRHGGVVASQYDWRNWTQTGERDTTGIQDDHVERWWPERVLAECEAKRAIIEFHKQWPVLVETEPRFAVGVHDSVNAYTMHMSQQIAWTTEQEYVKQFGVEAPTMPMLRAIAAVYADHPHYDQAWALDERAS